MALSRFSVSFLDGRDPVEVAFTPRVQIEVERRWPDASHRPVLEGIYFSMWVALGKPGDFEAFLDVVEDFEPVAAENVDPSKPVAGDA